MRLMSMRRNMGFVGDSIQISYVCHQPTVIKTVMLSQTVLWCCRTKHLKSHPYQRFPNPKKLFVIPDFQRLLNTCKNTSIHIVDRDDVSISLQNGSSSSWMLAGWHWINYCIASIDTYLFIRDFSLTLLTSLPKPEDSESESEPVPEPDLVVKSFAVANENKRRHVIERTTLCESSLVRRWAKFRSEVWNLMSSSAGKMLQKSCRYIRRIEKLVDPQYYYCGFYLGFSNVFLIFSEAKKWTCIQI